MVLHLAWLYVSGNLRPMAEAAKAVALRCSQDSNRMFTLFRSRFYRLKLADHAALQMMATGELSTAAFNGAPSSNKIVFGYPYVQCPFLIRRPACQVRRLVIDYSQTEKCVGQGMGKLSSLLEKHAGDRQLLGFFGRQQDARLRHPCQRRPCPEPQAGQSRAPSRPFGIWLGKPLKASCPRCRCPPCPRHPLCPL